MTTTDTNEPPKRRRGWRLLGLLVLALVLSGIAVGFWWYHNDSDLEEIRALARQQGRPLVWNDLGLTQPTSERMGLWKRVVALSGKVSAFQSQLGSDGKSRYKPWDPIPDEMRAHHAAIDPVTIAELNDVLDRLGDGPLVLHDQLSYERKLDEIGVLRSLIRFLQERLILAGPHEAGPIARRMLATCRRMTTDSLILHLVCSSLVDATMQGIALRLSDLKTNDPTIAQDILLTIHLQHGNLLRALDGEFLLLLGTVKDPGTSALAQSRDTWYIPVVIRAGHHQALSSMLEAIASLRGEQPDAVLMWAKAMDARMLAARGGLPTPGRFLEGLYTPAWGMVVQQTVLVRLRGQVIAAESQGAPWPVDAFDPAGALLREVKRDGRVIAAYSVHSDGTDQSGDEKRDRVFPLYAKP